MVYSKFYLKKQSEDLLTVAKKAVESAIEENETIAMGILKKVGVI